MVLVPLHHSLLQLIVLPRLGRRFVGPLMCYAQPGLHDLLLYSLYSRLFQLFISGSHQVPIATQRHTLDDNFA